MDFEDSRPLGTHPILWRLLLAVSLGGLAPCVACSDPKVLHGIEAEPQAGVNIDAGTPSGDAGVSNDDAGRKYDAGEGPANDAGSTCVVLDADAGSFSAGYRPLASASRVQDKAFYLLTLFDSSPRLKAAFAADATLQAISKKHDAALRAGVANCGTDLACLTNAVVLSEDETTAIAVGLPRALAGCELATLAANHMRPSGAFILHATGTDDGLIYRAWLDTAVALRHAYDGYAAPLDGATLHTILAQVVERHPEPLAFYEPLLHVVLGGLTAQGRDEAARYEPLALGHNAAALARVSGIVWAQYQYAVILVPGQGPENADPLNPIGRERCNLAASRFFDRLAPFIFLSGGHVHPDRTPYSEALEMKKYLMAEKGVPESAILIDPHARHTTTNLRNVSRHLLRAGVPESQPVLVTSDPIQSAYFANHNLALDRRCNEELGYLPYLNLKRVTANDTSFSVTPLSLQLDGRDPLDP